MGFYPGGVLSAHQKDQLGISSHDLKNGDCIVKFTIQLVFNTNSWVAPSQRFISPTYFACVFASERAGAFTLIT